MSMSYVAILAVWGSAGGKRLALFEGQRVPIRFAGAVRTLIIFALIILRVVLLIIFFRILVQKKKELPSIPETLRMIIHLHTRRRFFFTVADFNVMKDGSGTCCLAALAVKDSRMSAVG